MKEENKIDIAKIENPYEKDILSFLNKNGRCIYGDIMKELKLSYSKGQEAIYSLLNKGFIKHRDNTSYIELNVQIKK